MVPLLFSLSSPPLLLRFALLCLVSSRRGCSCQRWSAGGGRARKNGWGRKRRFKQARTMRACSRRLSLRLSLRLWRHLFALLQTAKKIVGCLCCQSQIGVEENWVDRRTGAARTRRGTHGCEQARTRRHSLFPRSRSIHPSLPTANESDRPSEV